MAMHLAQTARRLSSSLMLLLVNLSCIKNLLPPWRATRSCALQSLHTAADHPHAKPTGHAPEHVAKHSISMAQTSTSLQAIRAGFLSTTPQISTQASEKGRALTSACSAQCCSASGIMPRMLIMATSSSSLTLLGRYGGHAISAQMVILTPGKQVLITGQVAGPAPSVQAERCVSTIPWLPSILILRRSSAPEMRAQLMITQLAVGRRCSGYANMDMNTLLPLTVGQTKAVPVSNVLLLANHHSPSSNILSWLRVHIQSCTSGMQSRMPKKVWIPTNSNAEAAKCATGSATVVPGGSLTSGEHQQKGCASALAVHAAVVDKLAYATPFSPCSLKWLLNGTTLATLAHLMTSQLAPAARSGGTIKGEAAFKAPLAVDLLDAGNASTASRLDLL